MKTEEESSPPHKATAVAKAEEEERGKESRNGTISQELQFKKDCSAHSLNNMRQIFSPSKGLKNVLTTYLNKKVKGTKLQSGSGDVLQKSFDLFGYDMAHIKNDGELNASYEDDNVVGYVVHDTRCQGHYYSLLKKNNQLWNMDTVDNGWPTLVNFDFVQVMSALEDTTVFIVRESVRERPVEIEWLPEHARYVLSIQRLQTEEDETRFVIHWNLNYLSGLSSSNAQKGKVKVNIFTTDNAESEVSFESDTCKYTDTLQNFVDAIVVVGDEKEVYLKDTTRPVPSRFWKNIPMKMVFDFSQSEIDIKTFSVKQTSVKRKERN